jgi:dihydroxyacetone kinase-like protein
MGIGHHGEPGVAVTELKPAKGIASDMIHLILPDLPFAGSDEVVVLVSGLGATPVMELYIFYGAVADLLADHQITVHRTYVGNYFTSLEMMGLTLTVMKVDAELKQLIDLEADSVGLRQF